MAQQYAEGSWFTVPVTHGQWAFGLIARKSRRGGLLLGYFFGPFKSDLVDEPTLKSLSASTAQLVCRFKEAPLHRGLWRVVSSVSHWRRKDWPMPRFLRKEGLSGRGIRVEYESDNLTTPAAEVPAKATDAALPEDIVYDEARLVEQLRSLFSASKPVTLDPGQWTG